MKRSFTCALLLLTVGTGFPLGQASAQTSGAASMRLDGYAAVVDGEAVLISDVMFRIGREQEELRKEFSGAELEEKLSELYERGLDFLIDRQLILAAFEEKDLQLPEQVVDDRVTEIINTRFKKNRAAFLEALDSDGLTLAEWKDTIRDEIKVSILRRQHVYDQASVSPQRVREAYDTNLQRYSKPEEINLQVIVLKPAEEGERPSTMFIEGLVKELRDGKDFTDTARALSSGPKASEGGLMGWTAATDLRDELLQAVRDLPDGGISDPVALGDQWFILKRLGYRPGGRVPFEEVQGELRTRLLREEEKKIYDGWMARLRDRFPVTRFR